MAASVIRTRLVGYTKYTEMAEVATSGHEVVLLWTSLHPDNWTANEVRSWIQNVADENGISSQERATLEELFSDVNGQQLQRMTCGQFQALSPEHGRLLHDVFKRMGSSNIKECDMTSAYNVHDVLQPIQEVTEKPVDDLPQHCDRSPVTSTTASSNGNRGANPEPLTEKEIKLYQSHI